METNKTIKTDLFKIDPRNIVVVDGFNCRTNFGDLDKLADEIKAQGVLNPISVIPFKDENGVEKYQLVDGERRYRAVMKLIADGVEMSRIPALFLSKSLTEEELLIQQALRNEGDQFSPYEWGILARKLIDKCGLTIVECSKKLGLNSGAISRYLGYLELDPKLAQLLKDKVISGPNLDRVLNAYNGDEEAAYKEIMGLEKKRKEKNEKVISLKDLDECSRVVVFKDSKKISLGLDCLFRYIKKYTENGSKEIEIDLVKIAGQLKAGKLITEILDELKQKAYANVD